MVTGKSVITVDCSRSCKIQSDPAVSECAASSTALCHSVP
jgi:hypothetical protein